MESLLSSLGRGRGGTEPLVVRLLRKVGYGDVDIDIDIDVGVNADTDDDTDSGSIDDIAVKLNSYYSKIYLMDTVMIIFGISCLILGINLWTVSGFCGYLGNILGILPMIFFVVLSFASLALSFADMSYLEILVSAKKWSSLFVVGLITLVMGLCGNKSYKDHKILAEMRPRSLIIYCNCMQKKFVGFIVAIISGIATTGFYYFYMKIRSAYNLYSVMSGTIIAGSFDLILSFDNLIILIFGIISCIIANTLLDIDTSVSASSVIESIFATMLYTLTIKFSYTLLGFGMSSTIRGLTTIVCAIIAMLILGEFKELSLDDLFSCLVAISQTFIVFPIVLKIASTPGAIMLIFGTAFSTVFGATLYPYSGTEFTEFYYYIAIPSISIILGFIARNIADCHSGSDYKECWKIGFCNMAKGRGWPYPKDCFHKDLDIMVERRCGKCRMLYFPLITAAFLWCCISCVRAIYFKDPGDALSYLDDLDKNDYQDDDMPDDVIESWLDYFLVLKIAYGAVFIILAVTGILTTVFNVFIKQPRNNSKKCWDNFINFIYTKGSTIIHATLFGLFLLGLILLRHVGSDDSKGAMHDISEGMLAMFILVLCSCFNMFINSIITCLIGNRHRTYVSAEEDENIIILGIDMVMD